jgi:hypothetical protein
MNYKSSNPRTSSFPKFKKDTDVEPKNEEFIARLPDSMIDEYLWYLANSKGFGEGWDGGRAVVRMLGNFGPRAEKAYIPIREWGLATGNVAIAKDSMDKIKKK